VTLGQSILEGIYTLTVTNGLARPDDRDRPATTASLGYVVTYGAPTEMSVGAPLL